MSDLQLSLLGLGVALVGGIWGYNKYQEHKLRKAAEKVFRGDQADVLLEADTLINLDKPLSSKSQPKADHDAEDFEPHTISPEPHLDAPLEPVLPVDTAANQYERREPGLISEPESPAAFVANVESTQSAPSVETAASNTSALAPANPPSDWCDSSTDVIGQASFSPPVTASGLNRELEFARSKQRMPVRAFGLYHGEWLEIDAHTNAQFAQVRFAMQLVDRQGAISQGELDRLRDILQTACVTLGGAFSFPDTLEVAAQAKALDDFCAQLDLQLVLNLLDNGSGAFPGTKLRGLAEAAGMRLNDHGEFVAYDEQERALFTMANLGEAFNPQTLRTTQTHGLTFMLDVPNVVEGAYAFERMLACGKQFASALGGNLVNAQRALVNEAMVDAIRKKIVEIHEQMKLAGIPAGGVRALRLFS